MPEFPSAPARLRWPSAAPRPSTAGRAMLAAAAMIAFQVAGKAARDALFLSHYSVTALPLMYSGSAALALLSALAIGRAMTRRGPARLIPRVYFLSALLLLAEWALLAAHPRLAAILVYLHVTTLGGVLISGFWSVVNERYDPRAGKREIGRIAGSATAGGLLGGLLAERVAAWLSIGWSLPLLAVLHLVSAQAMRSFAAGAHRAAARPLASAIEDLKTDAPAPFWKTLKATPFLRNLALMVCLCTLSNAAIDYVFIFQASQAYGNGEALLRFLALFYTATSFATFLIQAIFSRVALERLGLPGTVATWPLAVAASSTGALFVPGLASAGLARGAGSVFNDSLFRSGYELLYTPIPASEKRAAKSLVDTGASRLGEFLGGVLIRAILFAAPASAPALTLGAALGFSLAGLWVSVRIGRGYVALLEKSLLNRAIGIDISEVRDSTTRSAVLKGLTSSFHLPSQTKSIPIAASPMGETTKLKPGRVPASSLPGMRAPGDSLAAKIAALQSRDRHKVIGALRSSGRADSTLVAHVIPLLAWDDVFPEAIEFLRKLAPDALDQLTTALTDPEQPFAVRRRLPRVLSAFPSQGSVAGLLTALRDSRFEVRYQAGLALDRIRVRQSTLVMPPDAVLDAIEKEIGLGRKIWESQRLLDRLDDLAGEMRESSFADEAIRERASRSLEHVFRLLSFILPRDPLRVAFRGLHTDDDFLRGTALEYLDSVLPPAVRGPLWPYLEDSRSGRHERRSREEILRDLMRSHQSIEVNLAGLRKKREGEPLRGAGGESSRVAP